MPINSLYEIPQSYRMSNTTWATPSSYHFCKHIEWVLSACPWDSFDCVSANSNAPNISGGHQTALLQIDIIDSRWLTFAEKKIVFDQEPIWYIHSRCIKEWMCILFTQWQNVANGKKENDHKTNTQRRRYALAQWTFLSHKSIANGTKKKTFGKCADLKIYTKIETMRCKNDCLINAHYASRHVHPYQFKCISSLSE